MESKIKTIESAFTATKRNIETLKAFDALPEEDRAYMTAVYKRLVVTDAKNREVNNGERWMPDYSNGKWDKYYPYVYAKKNPAGVGFVVGDTLCGNTRTITYCGSRLCFKEKNSVIEFNNDFPELLQQTLLD